MLLIALGMTQYLTSGWVSDSSKHKYFLKGSNDMLKDHTPSGQFTEGGKMFSYPPLSSSNFDG